MNTILKNTKIMSKSSLCNKQFGKTVFHIYVGGEILDITQIKNIKKFLPKVKLLKYNK